MVHFLIGYQCEHLWWWWWWSFWRAVFVYFPLTDKFWLTIGRVACLLFERLDSIFVETTIFWCDKREINYKYRFWWWNFYRFSLVGNEKLFFFFFFNNPSSIISINFFSKIPVRGWNITRYFSYYKNIERGNIVWWYICLISIYLDRYPKINMISDYSFYHIFSYRRKETKFTHKKIDVQKIKNAYTFIYI